MIKIGMMCILALMSALSNNSFAGNIADYLILQDIGQYKFMGKGGGGQGAGMLAPTGHFSIDHIDESYDGAYIDRLVKIGVNVEVTQHSGSESDKWLLHELDAASRDAYGIPTRSYAPRLISGQTILVNSIGGRIYRWLSGNKVIIIEYNDAQLSKPEPLDVVQAYLSKHPSTLPPITLAQLRSDANKTTWIKDEMDRRLWLCDKWFMQLQLQKVQQNQVFQESIDNMNIFLDYREKYYGVKATDEKNLLIGYLNTNNGTAIKSKLTEYKIWWSVHKKDAISL